MTYNCNLMN